MKMAALITEVYHQSIFYWKKVFSTRNKTKIMGTPCRLCLRAFPRQREFGSHSCHAVHLAFGTKDRWRESYRG